MTDIKMMNSLAVDGKITASGDIEDGAGNVLTDKLDKLTTKPTAGTYKEITINAEGQVTGGANPTTLAGYGITDAVTLNTAQTITGAKTFVGAFTVQSGVSSVITIKNTVFDKNAVNTSYKLPFQINGTDANNNTYVSLNYEARVSDIRVVTLIGRSETKETSLQLFANESAQWAQVPYRTYASANVNDVVTIGSLASNPNVLHSTGNETKTGNLTVTGAFTTNNNLNIRKAQPRTSMADTATDINAGTITAGSRGFFALYDNSGVLIGDIIISIDANGKGTIEARARNADGTTRQAVLI